MLREQLEELVSRGFAVKTDENTYVMQKVCGTYRMRPDLPGIPPHKQKEFPMTNSMSNSIQVGDVVSYSGLVDPNKDDFNATITEYGVVVCIFSSNSYGDKDAYVAFTGTEIPHSIKEQAEEKPYILR